MTTNVFDWTGGGLTFAEALDLAVSGRTPAIAQDCERIVVRLAESAWHAARVQQARHERMSRQIDQRLQVSTGGLNGVRDIDDNRASLDR